MILSPLAILIQVVSATSPSFFVCSQAPSLTIGITIGNIIIVLSFIIIIVSKSIKYDIATIGITIGII